MATILERPLATSLTNNDKFFIETAGGSRQVSFNTLKEAQEGYFKRVIDEYMAFDYEDLTALRADGELIAGEKYVLTDYRTVYNQSRPGQTPNVADKVSDVEPLVLTAISTDEFSQVAYSPSFPQDIIWYNFDNELSPDNSILFYSSVNRISKGFKGIIIRRIDTQKNINYSYDWRTMKWWREDNEVLTFRDLSSTYNVVSGSNCFRNTFGTNCLNNTFGNNCFNNIFGDNCSYNTFGSGCYNNTFGGGCYGNTFGSDCLNNTFGSDCFSNTFGINCFSTTFGNHLQYADVKSGFGDEGTVTNTDIYNKNYNHTFYIDSSGNMKCYCINSSGALTNVPLIEEE